MQQRQAAGFRHERRKALFQRITQLVACESGQPGPIGARAIESGHCIGHLIGMRRAYDPLGGRENGGAALGSMIEANLQRMPPALPWWVLSRA